MSLPHIAMWLVVACVGLPSSWRNPTAFALTLSWMAGETAWLVTGNSLPLSIYVMADIAVIAVVCGKAIIRAGVKTYPTIRSWLRDITVWDRWIVAIFLLGAWPAYIFNMHPYYRWWLLYWLTVTQFLLAGGEAIARFRAQRRQAEKPKPIIDRHLIVIPFPLQYRDAEAVRNVASIPLLHRGGGYG